MLKDNPTSAPKLRVRGQVYADFVFLVNPGWGIQNLPRDLLVEPPLETKADAEFYIARLANIKPWSEQVIEALARPAKAGALPPRYVIDDTITYLKGLLKINGQDQPEAQILDIYTHFRRKIYQIRDIMG